MRVVWTAANSQLTVSNTWTFDGNTSVFTGNIAFNANNIAYTGNVVSITGSANVSANLFANTTFTRLVERTNNLGSTNGSVTPDWNNGTVQYFTANNNFTLNIPINLPVGATMTVIFTQDGSGNHQMITSPNTYIFASGIKTLTTTANAVDMLNIFNTGKGSNTYMAALTTDYK